MSPKSRYEMFLDYFRLFLRGFSMVVLVSANVYQSAHLHVGGAGVLGTAISVIWFYNARTAAHSNLPYAGWVYGAGAGVGTMTGLEVMSLLWGGR
jgi:hypothetical protein